MRRLPLLTAFAAAAFVPAALEAQGSLAEQTQPLARPKQVISINPFLPIVGRFQGEYERVLGDNVSLAVSAAHVRLDDDYTSVDVKVRLYGQERAPQGLGLAAGLGLGTVTRRGTYTQCDDAQQACTEVGDGETNSAPTFSVEGQYQWLLGGRRATTVAIGGGVKRYFLSDDEAREIWRVVPTLRLTVGYAF